MPDSQASLNTHSLLLAQTPCPSWRAPCQGKSVRTRKEEKKIPFSEEKSPVSGAWDLALRISTESPPACSQESHTSTLGRAQVSGCTWAVPTSICSGPGTHYSRGSQPTCSLRASLRVPLARPPPAKSRTPSRRPDPLTPTCSRLFVLLFSLFIQKKKKKKLPQNLASHRSVPIPMRPAPGGSPSSSGVPRCHEELSPAH